jgi:hypothetical protein
MSVYGSRLRHYRMQRAEYIILGSEKKTQISNRLKVNADITAKGVDEHRLSGIVKDDSLLAHS